MFTYDLREDKKKGRMVYTLSRSFRALCMFFALAVIAGLIILIMDDGWEWTYLIPIALSLILLGSALYRDAWVVDNQKREFSSESGIGPFVSRKVYPYKEVKRLELTHFIKGLPDNTTEKPSFKHRAFVVLSIRLKGEMEDRHELEIMPEKTSGGKLERIASLIASYSGFELYVDRPRDERAEIRKFF